MTAGGKNLTRQTKSKFGTCRPFSFLQSQNDGSMVLQQRSSSMMIHVMRPILLLLLIVVSNLTDAASNFHSTITNTNTSINVSNDGRRYDGDINDYNMTSNQEHRPHEVSMIQMLTLPMTPQSIVELWQSTEDLSPWQEQQEDVHDKNIYRQKLEMNRSIYSNAKITTSSRRRLEPLMDTMFTISLEFSVWNPYFANDEQHILLPILGCIRDFLCTDVKSLSMEDASYTTTNLDWKSNEQGNLSFCDTMTNNESIDTALPEDLTYTLSTPESSSNVSSFPIQVGNGPTVVQLATTLVMDQRQSNIEWTEWTIIFHVTEIFTDILPAKEGEANIIASIQSIQESLQAQLNEQITLSRGVMEDRFDEYYSLMESESHTISNFAWSIVGEEVMTFQESHDALSERFDTSKQAKALRWIGSFLLVLSLMAYSVLTCYVHHYHSHRHRHHIEHSEMETISFSVPPTMVAAADNDPECIEMLNLGKQQAIRQNMQK